MKNKKPRRKYCPALFPSLCGDTMSFETSRSANSCSKSKRSFHSNSSNNSSGGGKKQKTSNQKTLGAAWGAASRSSSRSSFRSSPFSDFGSYMSEKNRKLQNQYDAEASTSGSEKLIFQGVSIFVDGFTIPSSQELRSFMLKRGGRFQNYFSRRSVTHIICSNLPDSKLKNLRSFSRGLPVVKPAWILDSVSANRLLSWVPYQLDQLTDIQPKLSDFFAPRRHLVAEMALTSTICQPNTRGDDSYLEEATPEDIDSCRTGESKERREYGGDELDGVYLENPTVNANNRVTDDGKSSEVSPEELGYSDSEEQDFGSELQSSIQLRSASVGRSVYENESNDDISTPAATGSSRGHSTLEDPNFVENYFKYSRLHFIGTWRNRYRKRFRSSLNGLIGTDSGQNIVGSARRTTIIHIDLDCFFVAVVIKNRPQLQEKPVAVCHSDNPKGTAEISSANYPARSYGIKAGMFVRDAKDLCPQLVIVPYNFEAYEEVADRFYDILHKHCNKVQAVSCDEAFLDVTDLKDVDPDILASTIRKEIYETTGCSASAGIAGNMLMARLATRTAKPAGQFHISAEKVDEYLDQLPISALPGVGYVLEKKLKKQNIHTCGHLRLISKDSLQRDFGMKTGEMLWSYSRGLDHRSVGAIQESKSICAEVNWGVRFRDQQDMQHFLQCLCKEVSLRLQGCEMLGRTFTLKIKKRRKYAEEPAKYMGCGDCDNLSRSITVPVATDDVEVLQRIAKKLFGSFYLDFKDIRGVGLQATKLENADASKRGSRTLESWLSSTFGKMEQNDIGRAAEDGDGSDCERNVTAGVSIFSKSVPKEFSVRMNDIHSSGENQVSSLPPLCHLDMGVLESLPHDLLSELDETYGGKLVELIEKRSGKSKSNINSPHIVPGDIKGKKPLSSDMYSLIAPEEKKMDSMDYQEHAPQHSSSEGISNEPISSSDLEMAGVMPSSFSQVDTSVLQQLPEDLRADILGALPAHRKTNAPSDANLGPCIEEVKEPVDIRPTENEIGFSDNNLWSGNPPLWVHKFRVSSYCVLRSISEMYCKVQSRGSLSSILQHAISETLSSEEVGGRGLDEAVYNVCELLRQYIKLKIEVDIEEIYVCFRLLKRLSVRSQFFLQVYEIVFPYLQASISENYGGNLHIF